MLSCSSFLQVLYDNTMLFIKCLHILHHLQGINMMYFKLFLVFTFKYKNLAEKPTNLAENLKNIGSRGFDGVYFFQLWRLLYITELTDKSGKWMFGF